jgi:hypothetical protein
MAILRTRWHLIGAMAVVLLAPTVYAQSAEWDRTLLVYVLAAGIDGESQIGPVVSDVDQSFSDILENLDIGAMGSFRASKGRWAHTFDAIYTSLSGEGTVAPGTNLEMEIDQLIASYDIVQRAQEATRTGSIHTSASTAAFRSTTRSRSCYAPT